MRYFNHVEYLLLLTFAAEIVSYSAVSGIIAKLELTVGANAGGIEGNGGVSSAPNGVAVSTAGVPAPQLLDECSLDKLIEVKIARFFGQLGEHPPDNLYSLLMEKFEKTLLTQIMRYTGGNQMHASRLLGINRNTLRKRLRTYGIG